ncbi:transcription repressor OFP16-like [Primulina tabacum]|uniref:transcription repressor OFP16-like n=1 Tax=Primulina tabacum TaxID=48773 RepID=UPI003F5A998A
MSSILWKSFNLCFSKFKCLPTVKFADHESLNYQKSLASTSTPASVVEDFSSSDYIPNFASVFASQRFFFSTPGSSNSIFEPMNVEVPATFLSGGVAVQKYSPEPYADFHKSMQEMIEAHELIDGESSWGFLHELLCCYLTLNPKHTHGFIVDAFADVILSLATLPGTCPKEYSRQHFTEPPAVA